jgi:hypothetical protein
MPTQEMILADRHRNGEDVDPMEADDAALADGRRTAWYLIES